MHSRVVLGGTFDHFHKGHKALLNFALLKSKTIVVGLTKDVMLFEKEYLESVESYETREKSLHQFMKEIGRENDIEIVPITDVFGTTLTDATLEAIIATDLTLPGVEKINQARKDKGMNELPVFLCSIENDNDGIAISSTRIRQGLVSRDGFSYMSLFSQDLKLTDTAREELHTPIGEVQLHFPMQVVPKNLIAIGDVVTDSLLVNNSDFLCAYVDGMSQRKSFLLTDNYPVVDLKLSNPPGTISFLLARHIVQNAEVSRKAVFKISGEEDLLAIPAALLLPLGFSVVYGNVYGQEGVVLVTITEELKEFLRKIL
ncbi:MAG TPA: pantetheine-phosphate adenylyltransferase [Patescibacteria group bacterium]|nr:pantetheine-phosphate adenylyltransferase [Patescibacteria group bacterium]